MWGDRMSWIRLTTTCNIFHIYLQIIESVYQATDFYSLRNLVCANQHFGIQRLEVELKVRTAQSIVRTSKNNAFGLAMSEVYGRKTNYMI